MAQSLHFDNRHAQKLVRTIHRVRYDAHSWLETLGSFNGAILPALSASTEISKDYFKYLAHQPRNAALSTSFRFGFVSLLLSLARMISSLDNSFRCSAPSHVPALPPSHSLCTAPSSNTTPDLNVHLENPGCQFATSPLSSVPTGSFCLRARTFVRLADGCYTILNRRTRASRNQLQPLLSI